MVFYDPRDYSTIRVYSRDQGVAKYLCTAMAQTMSATSISAATLAEQNRNQRQRLLKNVRERQRQGSAALRELKQAENPLAIFEASLPTQPPETHSGSVLQESEIADEPSKADLAALRRKLRYRYKA